MMVLMVQALHMLKLTKKIQVMLILNYLLLPLVSLSATAEPLSFSTLSFIPHPLSLNFLPDHPSRSRSGNLGFLSPKGPSFSHTHTIQIPPL